MIERAEDYPWECDIRINRAELLISRNAPARAHTHMHTHTHTHAHHRAPLRSMTERERESAHEFFSVHSDS